MFFARRNVVATAVLLALGAVPAVYAQASYNFNLPAQPLADALRAVGSQGGVNVTFEPATVRGRDAPALKGSYSVRQALDHLLAGSGLVLRTTQGGSFLVEMGDATGKAPSAATQAKDFNFNIHPQNLANTLRTIALTTGQRIDFGEDLVSKKKADVVIGRFTAINALQRALLGTGLHAVIAPSGVVIILPGAASAAEGVQELPSVLVQATVEGLAATRVATALKEIPQSVSVISQETLQQQNANELADALDWATGITVQQNGTSANTTFSARGFGVDEVHVDGGGPITLSPNTTTAAGSPLDDLSEYDHIEILRGSDALFGGAGNPGATVSLQRKQPQANGEVNATVTIGSYNYYRAMLDATGSLGFDGALRGRIVASNTDQDYFYDIASRKQHKFYGTLQYDLTSTTMLTVGGSLEQVNAVPFDVGLPRYTNGVDPHLPRSTALAFPWNRSTAHNSEAFVQLEQRFNDDWKLKVESTLINQDSRSRIGASSSSGINPVTNTIPGVLGQGVASESSLAGTGDATLTGSFDVGGHRQEVIAGMDYTRQSYALPQQDNELEGPPLNPWSFDPSAYTVAAPGPLTPVINEYNYSYTKQIGGYAALRLRFLDGWSAVIGARDSYYRGETRFSENVDFGPSLSGFGFSGAPIKNVSTGVVTPYAGLTYDVSKTYSIYASYADIYKPNSGQLTSSGELVPPVRGVNLEVGAKGAWYGGLLNGSIALFKIDQRNNPTYFNPGGNYNNPNCCFVEGDNISKGVEVELSGRLTPNWQISTGYTFDVNRENANLASVPGVTQGVLSSITPKHMFKLWTDYRLPGAANRWSVGGGLRAQTSSYVLGEACPIYDALGNCLGLFAPYAIRQGFYTVTTLRAAYQINKHWSLALNIDNLFDRNYYQTTGQIYGGNWYGTPRSFMLTIKGKL
jgi:TonB-dependent siderophore receptor